MASRVWTAAELEKLTPARRHEIFEASVVNDLDQAPPELLARTRAKIERFIAEADTTQPGWAAHGSESERLRPSSSSWMSNLDPSVGRSVSLPSTTFKRSNCWRLSIDSRTGSSLCHDSSRAETTTACSSQAGCWCTLSQLSVNSRPMGRLSWSNSNSTSEGLTRSRATNSDWAPLTRSGGRQIDSLRWVSELYHCVFFEEVLGA